MNATPGPILPKICDWMLNKNYESHTRSQTIGNCFQFPSFRHRLKAITRESRTLPDLDLCLSSWFFAAAMANLRPQYLPLSAIHCKFYYFSWKILVFTILKPKRFFFKWQSSESQHRPFLLLSNNSFKAQPPSLFKTVILKAVQSVFKIAPTTNRYITLKLSFVFFQFHRRDDLRCYLCRLLFCFCFRCRCSFPLVLDS